MISSTVVGYPPQDISSEVDNVLKRELLQRTIASGCHKMTTSSKTNNRNPSPDPTNGTMEALGAGNMHSPGIAYSARIAAVCKEMNEAKGRPDPLGTSKLAKRRETNRRSARRCRKRRKEELEQLEDKLRRLSAETKELVAEKERLQRELQELVSKSTCNPFANQKDALETPFRGCSLLQSLPQQLFQTSIANDMLRSGLLPHRLQLTTGVPPVVAGSNACVANFGLFGQSNLQALATYPSGSSSFASLIQAGAHGKTNEPGTNFELSAGKKKSK